MAKIRVSIVTISDRSYNKESEDLSGPAIEKYVLEKGWIVVNKALVSDDVSNIVNVLTSLTISKDVELILTTGGTGISPRDDTPEATLKIIDKTIPGLAEKMRFSGPNKTPYSILSRSVAGCVRDKLVINLPGNPQGALESLDSIVDVIPHAIALLHNIKVH